MPFTDVPPSYHSSTTQSPLPLIAPYLSSSTLTSLCLVSRHFHTIFVPFLWGDPASHFGTANDAVYIALTRFKKTLRRARIETRALTHTLHLPPALSEIYGGPRPSWLRDVLEGLPNLQSLVVGGLPFFDHGSLMALRARMVPRRDVHGDVIEGPGVWEDGYGLKLLLASSEPNTTSVGLKHALRRFPYLVYLDLSFTKSAKDAGVLAALGGMGELQALKLQGVGLRDPELEVLANSIGVRVRLLDVRDNALTDMAVRSLMQACFLGYSRQQPRNGVDRLNTRRVEDWPVGMAPGPDFFSLDALRSEDLDMELLKQLTNPLTGRLAFEDIPQGGLTHLYISGNNLSVEGLSSLLKSQRLHLLDGGSVDAVKTISRTRSLSTATGYVDEVRFPGAEKLVPVLVQSASKNLTYLRVDHAVVTGLFEPPAAAEKRATIVRTKRSPRPSIDEPVSPIAEVAGDRRHAAEMGGDERHVAEMPAPTAYAVELPSDNHPIFELDATPMQPRQSFQPKDNQAHPEPDIQAPIRGEGAFAPEVNLEDHDESAHVNGKCPTAAVAHHTHDVSDESSTNSTGRSILSPVSPMTARGTHFQGFPHPTSAPGQPSPLPIATPTQSPPVTARGRQGPQQNGTPATATTSRASSPFPTPYSQRQARIEYLLSFRPSQLPPAGTAEISAPFSLHPSHLPNLRTLVLTSVPLTVPESSPVIPRLKAFIAACAAESVLSRLHAAVDYSLPPGKARALAEKAAAKQLFALQTIVLELAQAPAITQNKSSVNGNGNRAWQSGQRNAVNMSKSSTGDRDSENLWSAAADDFSFFAEGGGEEEDECGIYEHEKEKYFSSAAVWDDKVLLSPEDAESAVGRDSPVHGGGAPGGRNGSGQLSPVHAITRGATVSGGTNMWKSPRDLPMGRNRRLSNEPAAGRRSSSRDGRSSFDGGHNQRPFANSGITTAELPGTLPSPELQHRRIPSRPTSHPANYAANTNNPYGISPPSPALTPVQSNPEPEKQLDTIAELSAWRRERKAAYEAEMLKYRRFKSGLRKEDAEGLIEPFVEGYWSGKIEVVRVNKMVGGKLGSSQKWMVDYYGNRFSGFLYLDLGSNQEWRV
ncbi:uncharacterized protein AB675_3838 [Cyphellophora attinorum]|uniref:Uncharacterized protein n=1 Tax=Cyphellophora attinorum TaxID=1664694 RepID=A0A0N1H3D7_9EURO|nr:uncharacterized protein AB675_3838 [Phialophora attinorum]KPI34904.1 hypothetical protein AB675_3838 [Phialophora attinorum]